MEEGCLKIPELMEVDAAILGRQDRAELPSLVKVATRRRSRVGNGGDSCRCDSDGARVPAWDRNASLVVRTVRDETVKR
jgi:hypothetical protein